VQVTTEQIDPCKIALTITVEPEKVTAAKEKAFAQAAKQIQIPGFRRGKVPPAMARKYVDPDRVKQNAAETLVGPAYEEAVQEAAVEPFGGLNPDLELVEMNDDGPLVFKAFVPLKPVVTLGPYKGLELEKKKFEVTDEDVDRQLDEILSRAAEYPNVTDRTTQRGDVILANVSVELPGEEGGEPSEPRPTVVEIGKNIEDLDNGLVGMEIGETKAIDAVYPADFSDTNLAGKRAVFTVTINEIRAKNLPELNDEFVQRVHPTAKTPDELRAAIRESLQNSAEELSNTDLEFQVVSKIVEASQINFPDALLRIEMQADANQLMERLKQEETSLEDYLASQGQTQEELEAGIRAAADRRIRNSLVLSEIARADSIELDEADVDRIIEERANEAKVPAAALRAYAEKNNQMHTFRDQALTEKILAHLKEISTITEKVVTVEELRAQREAREGQMVSETVGEETAELAEPAAPLAVETVAPKRRSKKAAAEAVETTVETADTGNSGQETSDTAES
jgi:trigger factor